MKALRDRLLEATETIEPAVRPPRFAEAQRILRKAIRRAETLQIPEQTSAAALLAEALPRMVGWGRAMELSMLAERLPAEKAYEWGLVNRLYDDNDALMKGATEIAKRLANGPRSISLIRRAYWNTWSNSFEQQLDLEAQLQNQAGASRDFGEGVRAFLEKRDAEFTGE